MRTFTMGQKYRLHPRRFHAREDVRARVILEEKVNAYVGQGKERRIAQRQERTPRRAIIIIQGEVENWENDEYRENWGARHVMCGTHLGRLIPQSI